MKAGIPLHGCILGARTGPTQRIVGTQSIEQGKEPSLAVGSQLCQKTEPCMIVFKWKLEFPVALGVGVAQACSLPMLSTPRGMITSAYFFVYKARKGGSCEMLSACLGLDAGHTRRLP